jgi:hypothetical protein
MGINVTHVFITMRVCPPPGTSVTCISSGNVLDADIDRYKHAFLYGGVYHDEDVRMLAQPSQWHERFPALPWDRADLVVGVEFPNPIGTGTSGCCLQFLQWIFGARKHVRVMADVLRVAQQNVITNRDEQSAVELTGPRVFTSVILTHIGPAFDLAAVEAGGAAYASKITNETILVLPYRAFGIHPLHRGFATEPRHQRLAQHLFKGRWRKRSTA